MLLALLVSAAGPLEPLTRQGAQGAARHELAKPPYQQAQPPVWVRPLRWLIARLVSLWNRAAEATGGSAPLLVLILLTVAVVGLVLWRVGPMRRNARRGNLTFDLGADKSATDHRDAAETFARSQQWAEAVRERLRAISRDLEERVLVDRRPGRTAYELADEGGAALPGSAARLREAAELFVAIWYGSARASPEDYRRIAEIDNAVSRDRPARVAVAP